ncbi:hypothetical protein QP141_07250 [Alloscardovia omnicolens]|uniref:hypothetical protein n=1 Tax=Alloscardovia omnicolens TaxID=419015 RepID=UPI00254A4988|nr:hypothetical protein [Alloscardovia omnicolens]MDK6250219.1 hypothetical protein [Alloscardovia omnicolens]
MGMVGKDTLKAVNIPVKKGRVDKAGKVLETYKSTSQEFKEALDIANQWRLQHLEPLFELFQLICDTMNNTVDDALASMRLKRMESIINKLKRPKGHFKLGEIDDIGGCRIIVATPEQIQSLQQALCSKLENRDIEVKVKDYVFHPNRSDGYRSVHLLVRIPNGKKKEDGKTRLEIQIRTEKQHLWATTIETLGSLYSADYKTPVQDNAGQEEKTIRRYFSLVSNLIALEENCPTIAECPCTVNDTLDELRKLDKLLKNSFDRDIEKDLKEIRDNISELLTPENLPTSKKDTASFYLFRVSTSQQITDIDYVTENNLRDYTRDFFQNEESYGKQGYVRNVISWDNVVLAATSDADNLKLAYPSYFLDPSQFIKMLTKFTNTQNFIN